MFQKSSNFSEKSFMRGVKIIVIALLSLIILINTFTIVPAGHTGVTTIFGAVQKRVLDAGLHMKIPFISRVHIIDNRVQRVDVDAESASKDLQTVASTISLNFRVNKGASATLFGEIGVHYQDVIIRPAIQECMKAVTAMYTAEELITKRQQIGNEMNSLISDKINKFGLETELINITNFSFSEEYNKAIEAKQTAQQNALKAEQDLLRIEVEARQQITKAEAEAEAFRLRALQIDENIIRMEAVQKWDGKMPEYYSGNGSGNIFTIPIQ